MKRIIHVVSIVSLFMAGLSVCRAEEEPAASVLAHLKLGSTCVKVGDKVARGQVMALCGNSGNSSEPHLHYHIQNTPVIQDGTGIKCFFEETMVNTGGKKELKGRYSPVKGDVVYAGGPFSTEGGEH